MDIAAAVLCYQRGLLLQAKNKAQKILTDLTRLISEGYHIVGLEPSCILTIKDDYIPLLGLSDQTQKLAAGCSTIDSFLYQNITPEHMQQIKKNQNQTYYVHTHCHQRALEGTRPTLSVLNCMLLTTVTAIDAGCCGMAGSFGYESEHFEFSQKIAETRLLPAIREAPHNSIIIANGMSCRQQIHHATDRHVQHLVQVIADRWI